MLRTLAQNWWAIVLRGLCAVLFGVSAFAWPGITLAILVSLYGAYALVEGAFAVAGAVMGRRAGAFPWGVLLAGLAGIAIGVITFMSPGVTAIALVYLIATWAVLRGVFEIIAADPAPEGDRQRVAAGPRRFPVRGARTLSLRRAGRGRHRRAVVDRRLRLGVRHRGDRAGLPAEGPEGPGRAPHGVGATRFRSPREAGAAARCQRVLRRAASASVSRSAASR